MSNVPVTPPPSVPSGHYRPPGSSPKYDPFGPYRGVPPKPSNREYTPEEYVLLFKRFS